MGNRAVIEFKNTGIGIYLHWNGGRESVEAFLKAGKDLQVRSDDQYAPARLCQIIGNYFGGSLSLGIGPIDSLDCDNMDNGTYVVERWQIVDTRYGAPSQNGDLPKSKAIYTDVMNVNAPIFASEGFKHHEPKPDPEWLTDEASEELLAFVSKTNA